MATLNIDSNQFSSIILIWLLDQLTNPEQITNENLKNFLNKHGSTIKSSLLKQYLDMDSDLRLKYRRISGVFNGSDKSIQQIRISPDLESKEKDEKEGKLKKLVKGVAKKILTKEELTQEDIKFLIEINNMKMEILNESIKNSMDDLIYHIKNDNDYAMSWFHNLSVTFQDVGLDKKRADEGAGRFMKLAFDIDINF